MSPRQLEHTDHAMIEWCARNGLDANRIPAHGDGTLEVRPCGDGLVATWREVIDEHHPAGPALSRPYQRVVDSYPPSRLAPRRHEVRYDVTLDDSGRPASWSVRLCDCDTPWRHS